jgi:hypothetical protein
MRLIAGLLVSAGVTAGNTFSCSAGAPTAAVSDLCPQNSVTIQITMGIAPVYSWSPPCGMSRLVVSADSQAAAVWTVDGNVDAVENPIQSGVRYGQTPDFGRTVAGPEPLERGVQYRVEVRRLECEQSMCLLVPAGAALFRP